MGLSNFIANQNPLSILNFLRFGNEESKKNMATFRKNFQLVYKLYSTKFSVMPDVIRHPEKPAYLIHLDSGFRRNDDII